MLTIIKMRGGKRKDGKEGEVQGDEMERKEKKMGKIDSCLDDVGMTVLVWALWTGRELKEELHRGRGSVQQKENESKQTIVVS